MGKDGEVTEAYPPHLPGFGSRWPRLKAGMRERKSVAWRLPRWRMHLDMAVLSNATHCALAE